MLEEWNREIKRQGSRSVKSNKNIKDNIKKVASQEVEAVTDPSLSKAKRSKVAAQIDNLYSTFPIPMFSALHEEYEKEVKKGIKGYIKSQR